MLKKLLYYSLAALFVITSSVYASCPKMDALCTVIDRGMCSDQGTTSVDSCWSYFAFECEPCARANAECDAAFPGCQGNCSALSTDQTGAECRDGATRRTATSQTPTNAMTIQEMAKQRHTEAEKLAQQRQATELRMRNNERQLLARQAKERAIEMEAEQRQLLLERQEFERQQLERLKMQAMQRLQRPVPQKPAELQRLNRPQ